MMRLAENRTDHRSSSPEGTIEFPEHTRTELEAPNPRHDAWSNASSCACCKRQSSSRPFQGAIPEPGHTQRGASLALGYSPLPLRACFTPLRRIPSSPLGHRRTFSWPSCSNSTSRTPDGSSVVVVLPPGQRTHS